MAKKLKITQIKSRIGSQSAKHVKSLDSLGLRKNYRTVYKNDTPQIRGMITKVAHLVEWEEIDEKDIPAKKECSSGLTLVKKGKAAGKSSEKKDKDGEETDKG